MLPSSVESWRTTRATWIRNSILMLVSAALAFTAISLSISEVRAVLDLDSERIQQGQDVLLVTSQGNSGLPAAVCENLSDTSGIVASGSILSSGAATVDTLPGRPAQLTTVTPGFLTTTYPLWIPQLGQVFTTADTADEFGWVPGAALSIDGHTFVLDATLPERSTRGEATGTVWVTQAADGVSRECYARTLTGRAHELRGAVQAIVGPDTTIDTVVSFGSGLTPQDQLETRLSQWGWAIVGLLIFALQIFALLGRRKDFALYRLLGFTPAWIGRLISFDLLTTVTVPAIYGICMAVAVNSARVDEFVLRTVMYDGLAIVSMLLFVSLLLTVVFIPRRPLDAIKES